MNQYVDMYINIYYNKSITKCVADAIQTSRLFLSRYGKANSYFISGC